MKLSHISLAVLSAITLAACGGGSDNAVVNSQNGGKKEEPKKEEPKKDLPEVVAQQLKFSAPDDWDSDLADKKIKIKGAGDDVEVASIKAANLAGGNFSAKAGYVQNSKLLMKNGKTVANPTTIFAKNAKGDFAAVVKGTGDAAGYVFAPGTKAADATKKDNALKASEVYQKAPATLANDQGSYLTKVSVFGSTYNITDADSFPEDLTFDKLEAKKVVNGKTVYTVNSQVVEQEAKMNTAGTAVELVDVETADGQKSYLNTAADIDINHYKAYKQAYSTVVLATNAKYDDVAANPIVEKGKNGAANIIGVESLGLPTTGTASYTGKAFTAKSTGDLKFDVQFGANKYLASAEISKRTQNADGKVLTDLVSKPKAAIENNTGFTLDLKSADDSVADNELEYNELEGNFYGSNAEEVAGVLKKTNVVGGFAASK